VVLEERQGLSRRRQLTAVFQHWQVVIDRFPVAVIGRFAWRVPIDAPVREHLRDLRFTERAFFTINDLQV